MHRIGFQQHQWCNVVSLAPSNEAQGAAAAQAAMIAECAHKKKSCEEDVCSVTYKVTITIQQGSPGVARIDGCICLNHILHCHPPQLTHIKKQDPVPQHLTLYVRKCRSWQH